MSQRVRAVLGFLGFLAMAGILMSDRFQDISDAVPEKLYYYIFVVLVVGMTLLGFYSWWQNYNGRPLNPRIDRLKK